MNVFNIKQHSYYREAKGNELTCDLCRFSIAEGKMYEEILYCNRIVKFKVHQKNTCNFAKDNSNGW